MDPDRAFRNASPVLLKFLVPLLFLVFTSCDQPIFRDGLHAIRARGELRVITRNNEACYHEGPLGPVGFEYDLAKAFARQLGVNLRIIVLEDYAEMVKTLLRGDADVIAAGLTIDDHLKEYVALGPAYRTVDQVVVGRRGGPDPRSIEDLCSGSIWVSAGSPSEKSLKRMRKRAPSLAWNVSSSCEPEELLRLARKGTIPLTVAGSDVVAVNRRYYPELKVHFILERGRSLVWAFHPQALHLQKAVFRWFSRPSTCVFMEQLKEHYYSQSFDYVDLMRYHRRIRNLLPRFRPFFERAAEKFNLDWRLIAAQSYQESHWNPQAESFTGVKGMMMLTLKTGKDLNVEDRLDPEEAIFAGARYLAQLRERIDDQVPEPDRTYLSLAAYNVGWDHLQDAGVLAANLGRPTDNWQAFRSTLPLLSLKKFYCELPHGYARGNEPVQYVDRIRTYFRILVQNDWKTPSEAGISAEQNVPFRVPGEKNLNEG